MKDANSHSLRSWWGFPSFFSSSPAKRGFDKSIGVQVPRIAMSRDSIFGWIAP